MSEDLRSDVKLNVLWDLTKAPGSRPVPLNEAQDRIIELGDVIRLVDFDLASGHILVTVVAKSRSMFSAYVDVEPVMGSMVYWRPQTDPPAPTPLVDIPELIEEVS